MACDYLNTPPPHTTGRLPVKPAGSILPPVENMATKEYVLAWFKKVSSRIDELVLGSMEPATDVRLGGVIIGDGVNVDASGRISVPAPDLSGLLDKSTADKTYASLNALTDYLTRKDASSTYATKQELAGLELTGDYVPLTQDRNGGLSAATVGGRSTDGSDKVGVCSFSSGRGNIASGDHSHAEGDSVVAKGLNSHAEGCTTKALDNCSHAEGKYTEASGAYSHAAGFRARAQKLAYAWSGVESDTPYDSNGDGTYNINPAGGIEGFYVGDKNLKTILSEEAPVPDLSGYVKKTGSGGVYLGLQYSEDMENPPLFLEIEGALKMGQPSTAGDEALLEMQAGGRPGGFKVRVTPSYDETAGEEVSSTTMSIDDIPDVADELRKISAKRDRTDNIAAADEVGNVSRNWVCSPSKVVYDEKEWELSVKWISENPENPELIGWAICFDGEPRYGYTVFKDREATTLTWRESDDWTGYETITATASGELLVEFYTKSGEPYVTPTGVKGLLPSPFHTITPEVTDTTVTLKPVDGAANWVDGKVEVGSARPVITSVGVDIGTIEAVFEFFDPETGEIVSNYAEANNIHIECALEDYNESSPSGVEHFGYWNLRTTSEVVCANPAGTPICTIPSGITFTAAAVSSEKIDGENVFNEYIRLFDLFDLDDKIIWHTSEGENLVHWAFNDIALIQNATVSASRSSKICLPTSIDTTKAHKFTLAVETDAETEKAVEWQGGEVIEAVPGASKLVPGLTVWDVAEVAPGKFRVERASSPAQSAPLTLTAPNGRVAELTVGDDLVLEVKEVE